ncbi:MAG: FHA domain-containing protein [Bdellovibrio sp.]|nr:FHA domain-containing protein [Bdellovibrio sp.]
MGDSTKILSVGTGEFVLHHVNLNRLVNLYSGLTFGRTEGNELFPNDPLVSKVHCKIHINGSEISVEDLGSSNRSKVNGKPIPPNGLTPLRIGDSLEIGNQHFVLQKKGAYAPSASGPLAQTPTSESFEDEIKSFSRLRELRLSTYIIFAIGPAFAFYLYDMLADTQCKSGVTPFTTGDLMSGALIKCLLIALFYSFVNHSIGRRFRGWSWQSIILGVFSGSFCLFTIIPFTFNSALQASETNSFACSCMSLGSEKTIQNCLTWIKGGSATTHQSRGENFSVRTFRNLPKESQKAISDALTPYLAQLSQAPSGSNPSRLPVNTSLTQAPVAGATPGPPPFAQTSVPPQAPQAFSAPAPQLSREQMLFIESQHRIAFDLFRNREYEKAIHEVRKIFALVNDYKDAREIEKHALEGMEIQQKRVNSQNFGSPTPQSKP